MRETFVFFLFLNNYGLPDAKSFKLFFNETFVGYWLNCIQHNQNTVACPCSADNLHNKNVFYLS